MTPGPRKRVAVAERWRSFAAASAVVGRRQASGPRWGRDRIPKDADGRLRVFRRLAVLFYLFFFFFFFLKKLNVIWRLPAPPPAPHDGIRLGFLRVVLTKLGRDRVARTILAYPPPRSAAKRGREHRPKGGGGGLALRKPSRSALVVCAAPLPPPAEGPYPAFPACGGRMTSRRDQTFREGARLRALYPRREAVDNAMRGGTPCMKNRSSKPRT